MANKNQFNGVNGGLNTTVTQPISKFPPTQEQTTPPWMKKKEESVVGNTGTMMGNSVNQANLNNNQPAWMKNNVIQNQGNSNDSSNVPPWMKNK